MTHYRILHVLDAPWGWASQSEMLNEALLDSGHGVTALRPSEMPAVFEGRTVRSGALVPFLQRSRPQLLIVNDGIELAAEDMRAAAEAGILVLRIAADGTVTRTTENETDAAAKGAVGAPAAKAEDAPVSPGEGASKGFAEGRDALFRFAPSVNRSYQTTELANFIVQRPCVITFGAHTQERAQLIDRVRDDLAARGCLLDFAFIGQGWEWHPPVCRESALAYASRCAVAAVVWPDATADIAVPLSDGVATFALDAADFPFACAGAVAPCAADPTSLAQALETAARNAPEGDEWMPAPRRPSLLAAPSLDDQAESLLSCLRQASLLGPGCERPAVHVCLCGYYGTGNFGDEAILDHLTQRAEENSGLAVVAAIAADPDEVWRSHGIEAMRPDEHGRIARLLARSSLLAITAGLLFDQGMRWTCGTGAVGSHLCATDLPGLANVAALAHANDVPTLFYGTGDGPLALEASRRMVALAAGAGARFFPRSTEAAALVRSCGVADSSVIEASDALYGLDDPGADRALAWADRRSIRLERPVVVALREWPGLPKGWERSIAAALDELARAGCTIVFVDFEPCDRKAHEPVQSRMSQPYVAYGPADDREEVLSLLSAAWAGLSLRLHCALVLGRFGKPSVGIAYLPKVEALFSQLGISELLVQLGFTEEELRRATDRLRDDHDRLALAVQERVQKERTKLAAATAAFDELLAPRPTIPERRWWPSDHSAEEDERARLTALEAELEAARTEADAQRKRAERAEADAEGLRNSRSFRLGQAITAPVARLRDAVTQRAPSTRRP